MKFNLEVSLVFLLILFIVNACFQNKYEVSGILQFENNIIKVDVYVVSLEGVDVSGVGNVSRVLEGVNAAIEAVNIGNYSVVWPSTESGYGYYENVSRYIYYDSGGGFGWTYLRTEFPVNATLHVVKNWTTYRDVVENRRECIIFNNHGAVLPIPEGHSRESWTDKIAEAMLYRNVTWVHVGGYPFYYTQYEGTNNTEIWEENGFKHLMQHINKGTITILQYDGFDKAWATARTELYLKDTWRAIYEAKSVLLDYPLLCQDFEGYVALPIWNLNKDHAGAVISFTPQANTSLHGFYVHIGVNQTFDSAYNPTDTDFYRGYMGCAAGLWSLVSRTARETLIAEAEGLIQQASQEGRTIGLQTARNFLEIARSLSSQCFDRGFLRDIYYGMLAAVNAEKTQNDALQTLFPGLGLGIACAAGICAVVWYKRRNNDRRD